MTWGTESWGTSSWGGSGHISIDQAFAVTVKKVRVELSAEPLAGIPIRDGDARNPLTWKVTRVDDGTSLTVIDAEVSGSRVDLFLIDPLGSFNVTYKVESSTLRSKSGNIIESPKSDTFVGLLADDQSSLEAKRSRRGILEYDLQNPPLPKLLQSIGGTLVVEGGDYALESGTPLLKKLIIRRLITRPGDFFHLPNYGVGLRVKEPLPAAGLVQLQTKIRREILREPEVEDVVVRLSQSANSLVIRLKAKLSFAQEEIDIPLNIPLDE